MAFHTKKDEERFNNAAETRRNRPQWKVKLANELLTQKKKIFPRRRVYAGKVDQIWALDLADVAKYKKQNRNCTFILVIIDIFSKKAWCRALKNKTGAETLAAFKDVVKSAKTTPQYLWGDKGGEFYNNAMKQYLNANNITLYSTYNDPKSCIAERFIRTLRLRIERCFILNNSTSWFYELPSLIDEYNSTKHRSIGMTPEEARLPRNFNIVYKRLYGHPIKSLEKIPENKLLPTFLPDMAVRIDLRKKVFEKSSTANFSEEIYIVDKILNTQPITYKIKDQLGEVLNGSFYPEQLLKTDQTIYRIDKVIRRRVDKASGKKQMLIRWKGYSPDFDSWEDCDTVLPSQQT